MRQAVSDERNAEETPETMRERITHLQERLGKLETDALGRVSRALTTGNAKLLELDRALARVSPDDWTIPAVRRQLDALRARAESARANALKRVAQMPGTAVAALASGARAPIQSLTSSLKGIATRIEARSNGADGAKDDASKAS